MIEKLKQGLQIVIAVSSTTCDVKEQVEFGR
ncbi:Uncharacterised protein [Vibrio cholerae]|nr:Uncharacterised protein [Vibrio cholerae]CSI64108.1 Uncharacterised protein [Vibrio cholerae]